MIPITPAISIAESELEESFIRSTGPGGQNVNKVETAVQLRFDAANSPNLPEAVRARLETLAGSRMTRDGVIVITANRFRRQERNRQDARDRLVELLRDAATPPKPRRPTRTPPGSKRKRLADKRRHSDTKQARGRVDPSD